MLPRDGVGGRSQKNLKKFSVVILLDWPFDERPCLVWIFRVDKEMLLRIDDLWTEEFHYFIRDFKVV